MNSNEVQDFSNYLKALSVYVKNLIVYKAKENGKDRVHIRAFQSILERKMEEHRESARFFNRKDSVTNQLLDYLISCGEVVKLENGYYTVLPVRHVRLPISKSILKVGELRTVTSERKLGLSIPVEQTLEKTITLKDYRYDFSMKDWMSVFQKTEKSIELFQEEYYEPTKLDFKRITQRGNLKENELYYIVSHPPLGEMKEHYIARRIGEDWQGERINGDLWKSRLSLLASQGYCPSYRIKKDNIEGDYVIYQIILSDCLPKIEREQVYLFSLPQQLDYCKKYYVQEEYFEDFLYVLKSLKFIEGNDR